MNRWSLPDINVVEFGIELCLFFDCFGDIPACIHRVPGKLAKMTLIMYSSAAYRSLKHLDHLMMHVRGMEVNIKRWCVVVMDLRDDSVFGPEINAAIPVRSVKNPHLPSDLLDSLLALQEFDENREDRSFEGVIGGNESLA